MTQGRTPVAGTQRGRCGDTPGTLARQLCVLSRGMQLVLETCPETEEFLRTRGSSTTSRTSRAVALFNRLCLEGKRVGGVFHSTC